MEEPKKSEDGEITQRMPKNRKQRAMLVKVGPDKYIWRIPRV